MEGKIIIDHHDWNVGHILLRETEKYFYLYIGNRDLQFDKNGFCVGSGSYIAGKATYPDCKKCLGIEDNPNEYNVSDVEDK